MSCKFVTVLLLVQLMRTLGLKLQRMRFTDTHKYIPKNYEPNYPSQDRNLISRCKELQFATRLDHFSRQTEETFMLRYFTCNEFWNPKEGSIFVYFGNEADVTLYLNNTGLMWELGLEHQALLLFMEHRYYGKSKPFRKLSRKDMAFLTTEQALSDYANLLWDIKREFGERAPVIGFGGSYGGMLGYFFRAKYPFLVDGVVASSAPIWAYYGEDPPYELGSFARIVTLDASPEKGSPKDCVQKAKLTWKEIFRLSEGEEGRRKIARDMGLCNPDSALATKEDVMKLAEWAAAAWENMAMANYPYPSGYIIDGQGLLPSYPVREACKKLSLSSNDADELLPSMAAAIGIFYNFTNQLRCYDFSLVQLSQETEDFWDYQFCTEHFMPVSGRDGIHDMFWYQPFNATDAMQECKVKWGLEPIALKPIIEWGGKDIHMHSNIIFSNGLMDPWSSGGVLSNISTTLQSIIIPEGAHHLDLMFSHEADPPGVLWARKVENDAIRQWIFQKRKASWAHGETLSAGSLAKIEQ